MATANASETELDLKVILSGLQWTGRAEQLTMRGRSASSGL